MTEPDDTAAVLLARSGLRPSSADELARMVAGYSGCRAMAAELWHEPLGDTAPLLPPVDG